MKQALALIVQYARMWQSRQLTSGVRSISHRESRVQFFDVNSSLARMQGGSGPMAYANSLVTPFLSAYMRHYV